MSQPVALNDRVDVLAERVTTAYWRLVVADPSPATPGRCGLDPAVAWVTEMAILGRTLPVNTSTEHALTTAVERLRALSDLAESVALECA